jgi:uncharacterized protein (DUF302 family)
MKYCFIKTLFNVTFDQAIEQVKKELEREGFIIVTNIDVQATLKKKLDVNFRKYSILGAFNPPFVYKALKAELNTGIILPCNVVVMEMDDGKIRVSAAEPLASVIVISNKELDLVAEQIHSKLKTVINNL